MGKVILDMAMSLDGIVTDKKGNYLYPINEVRGTEALTDLIQSAGAVVMDKAAYELAKGDFTDYEYQLPIFVFTETVPRKVAKGESDNLKFTFVTVSIKSTIAKAKIAAKDKNVIVIGWVGAAQKCLKNKLIDEVIVRLIPTVVGKGKRLFENFGSEEIKLDIVDSKSFPSRTDIKFVVLK